MSSPMNQFTRRGLLVITGATGAAAAAGLSRAGMVWATEGPSSYTPTWPSVDQHPPAPEWFQDAKFGIYFHWAEHHDGYSMWNSTVNEWNSVRTGPQLDLVRLHADDRNSVFDYERGGPAGMRTPYWLTDDSISSSSWCYTVGIGYYSLAAMLHSLVDRVSKNGNVLLNIAPMVDGTIPSGQRTLLLGMGDYLGRFGESLYATPGSSTAMWAPNNSPNNHWTVTSV